jgi:xanthine dehydrogenase molybdopterin-binding subunit B
MRPNTGRPVKLRLPRDDDMLTTGKRHGVRLSLRRSASMATAAMLALDAVLAAEWRPRRRP